MIYAQRAYVNVIGGHMLGANEDGFKIVIKTSGHTPANDVYVKYIVEVGYSHPVLIDIAKANWEAAGVLAPDGTYDIGAHANRSFTSDEQKRLQTPDEEFRVWCVGVIYYKDIFPRNPLAEPHNTHFCVFGEWGNPLFRAWSDGNDAD
jgi:hypothetical protein